MIRPLTCICMLLAGGSGLYLYQSKHRAFLLDREIGRTMKTTDVAKERIAALRAEWALLNEPERLSELSQQHLGLRTMTPSQFAAIADLGARLPPPLPPGSFALPAEDPAPATMAQSAPAQSAPAQSAPAPAPPSSPALSPPAPPRPAALPRPSAPALAAIPGAPPSQVAAARPAPTRPASRPASDRRDEVSAQLASAAPPPARPSAPAALAPRIATMAPTVPLAAAPISLATHLPAVSAIGESVLRASALGGARTALPPPTPYSAH